MCTTVSADLIAALQYEDTVIHQLERLEQSLYRLIHEASLLNLSPEVALSPAEEEHIKPFIESLQIFFLLSFSLRERTKSSSHDRSRPYELHSIKPVKKASFSPLMPKKRGLSWLSAPPQLFLLSPATLIPSLMFITHMLKLFPLSEKCYDSCIYLKPSCQPHRQPPMPSPQEVSQEVDDNIYIFSRFFILATIATLFISLLTFTFYYHVFFNRLTHIKTAFKSLLKEHHHQGNIRTKLVIWLMPSPDIRKKQNYPSSVLNLQVRQKVTF